MARRAKTETIIAAMRILADGIYSEDGVVNEDIAAAADMLAELHKMVTKVCTWVEDAHYDAIYEGACGIQWALWGGGPKENDVNFCPKCGGRVKIGKRKTETNNGV